MRKEDILAKVAAGEISVDEAARLLSELSGEDNDEDNDEDDDDDDDEDWDWGGGYGGSSKSQIPPSSGCAGVLVAIVVFCIGICLFR